MAEPTGVIRPQPRNAALGAIADALARAHTAASRVQFNPQIAPQFTLADLLPIEGAAGLMQDVAAYGPRAINKGGPTLQTFRLDPRVLDVAEAATYAAPLTRLARPVGRMAAQQIERAMTEGRGPLGAALGPVRPLPLDVYHGTPHRFPAEEGAPFGRFNAEKIGTGEGAQAYGHGHYTAEAQGVGEDYRKKLSKVGPQRIEETLKVPMDQAGALWAAARVASGDLQTNMSPEKLLEAYSASLRKLPEEQRNELLARAIQEYQTPPGTLYKIDLPDEAIDKMLDWDKPLSEQPYAYNKLKKLKLPHGNSLAQQLKDDFGISLKNAYGQDIERLMTDVLGPASATSDTLRQAGIPGIKYLDQVSRGAGEGTRNFVVFPGNEDLLRIIERNNEKLPESSPGYAEGGIVRSEFEYDPAAVDARAAALMEEIDAA